ncbi:hypothetical protein J2X54_003307 [Duganella sp. 3397]|uniref:hypothetical protein n=1 Tax=Duganella sp. 3397 TaxID=2817732 RepID=UPI0028602299|nr:hypothetical protein [Duganella sp. 3397]MDR7050820.1 hypothetical protein [Duganella sp. 3397]
MDADASATTTLHDYFSNVVSPEIVKKYNGPNDPLQICLIYYRRYIFGMIISLIYSDTISNNYNPKTHLFGYARFLNIIGILEIVLKQQVPSCVGVTEVLRKKIAESFTALSGSLHAVGYPMAANTIFIDGDNVKAAYTAMGIAVGEEAISDTQGRWAKLLPDLRKYLRAGRLAPPNKTPS